MIVSIKKNKTVLVNHSHKMGNRAKTLSCGSDFVCRKMNQVHLVILNKKSFIFATLVIKKDNTLASHPTIQVRFWTYSMNFWHLRGVANMVGSHNSQSLLGWNLYTYIHIWPSV